MTLLSILMDENFYFEDTNIILISKNAKSVAYVEILTTGYHIFSKILFRKYN